MQYLERTYRRNISKNNLLSYQIAVRETDLLISSDIELKGPALESVHRHRTHLEAYIAGHPAFISALSPLEPDDLAPDIIRDMLKAARLAGVGPMAAVAGAVAEHVGKDLLSLTPNVIVENGGDIFLKCNEEIKIGIFAGTSPLSHRLAIRIRPGETPAGVCTSSATVGPSLSLGIADAVCVKSKSVSLADAAATAIGNRVKTKKDIKKALSFGARIRGVLGILIIVGDELGAWGEMELI
ncbi:MAG: hypothetical protein CVU74_02185 [Deltaproteobacteria bacterium HGW-Deltaproteobacteria-9]|nr:MAG: hypothetical protein CVU74_02185 [Deltaproteobacteria bacterium HGW-Deltaproteobacteria-9]